MQNFLKQAIVQLPKIIMYVYTLTKIGPEIKHFLVSKFKIFLGMGACNPQNS